MKNQVRNLGFTLIEMIVAFSILGVAALGIGSFFVASTRSSSSVNQQSQLQNEAQLATNQIEKILIAAELGLNYEETSNLLYIFNANDSAEMELILLKLDSDNNIYYKEMNQEQIYAGNAEKTVSGIKVGTEGWELLAEDVEKFLIELDESGKKAEFSLTFANNRDSYEVSKIIRFRNEVSINKDDLNELAKNINVAVKTEITGVLLSVNPKITAYGGTVQLRWEVQGKGNIPQTISKWLVSTQSDMESVLEDKYVMVDGNGKLSIDLNTVKGPIYVQAVLETGERDENNEPVVYKSNVEELKFVENLRVTLKQDEGDKTVDLTSENVEAFKAETGMTYNFSADVTGEGLSAAEAAVVWSVESANGVNASISSDGKLEINKYSLGGSFDVVATLAKNSSVSVRFPMTVSDGHQADDKLVLRPVSGSDIVNRGAEIAFTATLNGKEVDTEDCNWSFSIKDSDGRDIQSKAVSVGTTGIVSVKDSLPYQYGYEITVDAKLKKDTTIESVAATVTVPEVSLSLTSPVVGASRGDLVDGFICTVEGVEDYEIDWSVAKSNYPNYFFGARGNTNITGYVNEKGENAAKLQIGSDESEDMTSIIVKASLNGDPDYEKTIEISTPIMDVYVRQLFSVVRDGGKISQSRWNRVNLICEDENGDDRSVTWSVKVNGQPVSVSNNFFLPSKAGDYTITATYQGVTKTINVSTN